MDEVSQTAGWSCARGALQARVVVYVGIEPGRTVSWRVTHAGELRVVDGTIWLTRHSDPYDYWMKPGDVVRLARGERVWVSTDEARRIEVAMSSCRRAPSARWYARLRALAFFVRWSGAG
jgi:hypothetical protein